MQIKKKKKANTPTEGLKADSVHWKSLLITSTLQLWMHQTLFSSPHFPLECPLVVLWHHGKHKPYLLS